MSFVDGYMNEELNKRLNPISRDEGAMAPVGDIAAQNDARTEDPSWTLGGTIAAGFRQQNIIGSLAYTTDFYQDRDPEFKPDLTKLQEQYLPYTSWIGTARNQGEYDMMLKSIDKQEQDKRDFANAPIPLQLAVGLAAGLTDPTVLVPGAGMIRKAEGGYSILRSALAVGAAGGAAVGVQEAGLHTMQATRTPEESLTNIGFGIVLGGLFGAAGAGIVSKFSKAEFNVAEHGFNRLLENPNDEVPATKVLEGVATAPEYRALPEYDWAGRTAERDAVDLELKTLRTEQEAVLRKMGPDADIHVDELPHAERVAELENRLVEFDREMSARTALEAGHVEPPTPIETARLATGNSSEVGAAINTAVQRELEKADYAIAGRVAGIVGDMTAFMNPIMRGMTRLSTTARKITADLGGGTIYSKANFQGLANTPGGAVKNLARMKQISRTNLGQRAADQIYAEASRNGTKMSRKQFERAVGLAMTRDDKDLNPYVQRAAEAWRRELFDPFKNEAIEIGRLPEDVAPAGALSYFSRVHDVKTINSHQAEFYARLVPEAEARLANAFENQQGNLETKMGVLDYELALLRAGPEERVQLLSEIDQHLDTLELRSAATMQSNILDLQAKAREARDKGDVVGEADFRRQAKELQVEGGQDLYNYKQARRQFSRVKRLLSKSESGQEAEKNKILDSLVDIEDNQRKSLETLITRGAKAKRELAKVSDDALEEFHATQLEAVRKTTGQAWDNLLRLKGEGDRIDEKIAKANEVIAKKVEAAGAGPEGSNMEAIRVQQEEAKKLVAQLTPARERVRKMQDKQQVISERLAAIEDRMANAEGDFDEMRQSITEGIDRVIDLTADKTLARGERMQRLKEKLDEFGPEVTQREIAVREAKRAKMEGKFKEKWGVNHEGKPALSRYAKEIVDEYFNNVTGRNIGAGRSDAADFANPITRGPLKGRTAFFTDEVLNRPIPGLEHGFLNNNATEIAHRYGRVMAGEIEIARQFGHSDMRDQIEVEIPKEYAELRQRVIDAPDVKAAAEAIGWDRARVPGTKEELLRILAKDEAGAIEDIKGVRDLIRGVYKLQQNTGTFAAAARSLTAFNFIRNMGGVVISNISELYRPAMVHGLGPYMGVAGRALTGQLDGIRLSAQESRLAGLIAETTLHGKLAAQWAEIGDPLGHMSAGERAMHNAAVVAGKWTGLSLFTDVEETLASTLAQNRMIGSLLKGVPKEKDQRWLAYLDLDKYLQGAIADELRQHATKVQGVMVANTEKWGNREAVEAYRQAIMKDTNSVIVQRTHGDLPLVASTPMGRVLMQFRAYNMAAHQKVMIRAMQEGPATLVSGLIGMTSLGALVSYLQAWRGGEERVQKWMKSAQNPGFLIGEGLDRSGLFPMLFDVNNVADAALRTGGLNFSPLKSPFIKGMNMMGGQPMTEAGDTTRWAPNNTLATNLGGPTASLLIDDLPGSIKWASKKTRGQQPTAQETKSAQRVVPYGSYFLMKEFLQALSGDSPYVPKH